MDGSPFVHDWDGHTVLHPLGLMAIIVLGIGMLLLPRRHAMWPMILMACFIAPAQRIVVLTLNFDLLRIMVLFGTCRVLLRSEWRGLRRHPLDLCIIAIQILSVVAAIILFNSLDAAKTLTGYAYDAIGMYFLFRCFIRSWEDVDQIGFAFAIVSIPVAVAFLIEQRTGRNLFAFLGGVPAITDIRDGRLRCQGAFAHSILAGCFWAAVLPLIALQWWRRRMPRWMVIVGTVCSLIIVVTCASSTPLMAVIFLLVAALFYRVRRWMRVVRWAIVVILVSLHLVMTKPVWHLIARVDILSGSTGWHRYYLIDEWINHAREWWLIGSNVGTAHWGYGLVDVTNEYIVQALHGGVALLLLFILLFTFSFRSVGQIVNTTSDRTVRIAAWAIGAGLFAHAMNFLAVSYFGQIYVVWYLLLAMSASLTPKAQTCGEAQARARRPIRLAAVQRQREVALANGS